MPHGILIIATANYLITHTPLPFFFESISVCLRYRALRGTLSPIPLIYSSSVFFRDVNSPGFSQQYVMPEFVCGWCRKYGGEKRSVMFMTSGRCVLLADAVCGLRAGLCGILPG
jgi:hypothetical protein